MNEFMTADGPLEGLLARGADDTPDNALVDAREQLFNAGDCGRIEGVQRSAAEVYKLLGIMFDLDPSLVKPTTFMQNVPDDPGEFYVRVVRQLLSRHPVLSKAEVRSSGTGLHSILWFDDPPRFDTDAERDYWTGIVRTVQASLPIDTDQPHITAVTRPRGSINSKNGAVVKQLEPGKRVSQAEVIQLALDMKKKPFNTVLRILSGSETFSPCPICGDSRRTLSALGREGKCYGGCGRVRLSQLYDSVLKPRKEEVNMEVSHAD